MNRGQFVIQAICSECGSLLMESTRLTRKQIRASWDKAVLDATRIPCDKCGFKFPNFRIDLKIVNKVTTRVFEPKDFIKLRNPEDPFLLFRSVADKWLKEHPNVSEGLGSDRVNEEGLKNTIEQRRKFNEQRSADSRGDKELV